MTSVLKFYPQETHQSCVPGCLRMVMAIWDIEVDEPDLRKCCRTDMLGTTAVDTAECAQRYGLYAKAIRNVGWSEVIDWHVRGLYPILFVNLFPLDALWVYHAVVLETFTEGIVSYVDPAQGRREASTEAFKQAWQMNKQQGIIISQEPL